MSRAIVCSCRECEQLKSCVNRMADACDELIRCLGEYVRQTMDSHPEWNHGFMMVDEAKREADRVCPRPLPPMSFEQK